MTELNREENPTVKSIWSCADRQKKRREREKNHSKTFESGGNKFISFATNTQEYIEKVHRRATNKVP